MRARASRMSIGTAAVLRSPGGKSKGRAFFSGHDPWLISKGCSPPSGPARQVDVPGGLPEGPFGRRIGLFLVVALAKEEEVVAAPPRQEKQEHGQADQQSRVA